MAVSAGTGPCPFLWIRAQVSVARVDDRSMKTERLAILENQRAMLRAYGWGETPGLDAEIESARRLAGAHVQKPAEIEHVAVDMFDR